MQEKLSVKKVYFNAYKYVSTHFKAYAFLTFLYFLGSLLSIGLSTYKPFMLVYYYLFLYFAAGFFYKQTFLLNWHIFWAAGLRFLTAILLFLAAILISTFGINILLSIIRHIFAQSLDLLYFILHSMGWLVVKYIFIFMLFIVFFIIPSFAFVSEITEKNRSTLTTFAKTKDNVLVIAGTAATAYLLILCVIGICFVFKVNAFVAEFLRDIVLVFITIVYFKMYDFFYKIPKAKTSKELKSAAGNVKGTKKTKEITVNPQGDSDVNQG